QSDLPSERSESSSDGGRCCVCQHESPSTYDACENKNNNRDCDYDCDCNDYGYCNYCKHHRDRFSHSIHEFADDGGTCKGPVGGVNDCERDGFPGVDVIDRQPTGSGKWRGIDFGPHINNADDGAITCTETSCQNNGTCVLVSDTDFECDCPVGFNGTLCESPPPCASDPCQNGGRCEEVEESFRCDCPPSTSGAYCEALLCENECHNGGECVVDESQFTKCNCSAGFLGYNCNMVDVCSGAVTPCDVFGSTATCQVVDEHASPFLVNATYQCLCPDGNNGQVECASLLSTTPLIANMPSVITTPAASLTSTTTSTSATSTTTSPPPPPTPTPTTTPSTTGLPSSTLTTELWSTTPTTTATAILAESSTAGSIRGAVEESTDGGGTGTVTIVLVVVGVAVLLLVLFFAALLSVRFVRRSRKLHGKYNPAKEESMVGAGLSLPMATINKEERLI
uniref:EGF-like domain-containing protein n=1 Tax=Plectus sambesii TaxID=2011161 RepID=A0A914V3R5_9BILA